MWPFKKKESEQLRADEYANAKAIADANRKLIAQAEAELAALRARADARKHKPIEGITLHRRQSD